MIEMDKDLVTWTSSLFFLYYFVGEMVDKYTFYHYFCKII